MNKLLFIMPRGKQTSSEDKAKIIEAKINNPDLSLRDIEKETGVNRQTTSDVIKKDLPEVLTSSDVIAKLIDDNNKILNITGEKLLQSLADEDGKIRFEDFIKARDLALKQNTLVGLQDKGEKEIKVTFEL